MDKLEKIITDVVINALTKTQGDISVPDQISNATFKFKKEMIKEVSLILNDSHEKSEPLYEKLMYEFGFDALDY